MTTVARICAGGPHSLSQPNRALNIQEEQAEGEAKGTATKKDIEAIIKKVLAMDSTSISGMRAAAHQRHIFTCDFTRYT